MKKSLIFMFIMIVLTGCVSPRQRHVEKMDSWEGQHINSLINSEWGYPDETTIAPSGNKLLIYYKSKTVIKNHLVYDKTQPKNMKWVKVPYTDTADCKTFFEINESGKIINVNWRGAACR